MKFGPVATDTAEGAVLAHSVTAGGKRLRKGLVLSAAHVATLLGDGVPEVTVARLDAGDIGENTAAGQLAAALVPDARAAGLRITTAFTGRVNLIAERPGVACLDVPALERFNGCTR